MQKFVLIDGNAILHRAFHALPPLTNKDGQQTNAVYGFFSMLFKIITDLRPEHLAVCFDRPKPTFRQELYVGYQAHRPKMNENLVPQIGLVHEGLNKAKIQIFEIDGYEADDLIGTLSKQAVGKEIETKVIIVSGDRDLLQLVNSHVNILAPIKGITKMILFDEEKVREKYGLKPIQIIDYKALVGDSSDNYPGVQGIGPKTAAELLKKYETFENLYKNLDKLPEKISKKLAQDSEQAALCLKLATIVNDVPIKLNFKEIEVKDINQEQLLDFFKKMGFYSLINRIMNKKVNGLFSEEIKKDKKNSEQLGLI